MSGQGPYYGQLGWYKLFEKEPNQSAIDRYTNEANRVSGILDEWLGKEKGKDAHGTAEGPWLVGSKLSYADIAFIPWQRVMELALNDVYDQTKFPHVQEWYQRITARPAFQTVLEKAAESGGH